MKALKQLKKRVTELETLLEDVIRQSHKWVKTELQNTFRVEQQDTSLTALYLGIVVSTEDPWSYNRVQFFCPMLHNRLIVDIDQLPWAWPMMNQGGFDDAGCTWIPPAGSVIGLIFEAGNRDSAYYIGTTWQRDRSKYLDEMGKYLTEYNRLWRGHRHGYMVGKNETQVFPPWNAENYRKFDIDTTSDFEVIPDAGIPKTKPHIYGWKTPEKHMIKMDDGDPECFHRWKRFEIQSSMGARLLFKDDHLHPCGEWLNPKCKGGGDQQPSTSSNTPQFTVPLSATAFFSDVPEDSTAFFSGMLFSIFTPALISIPVTPPNDNDNPDCDPECGDNEFVDTPILCGATSDCKADNKYHKHRSECGLCLQNKCFLDQSGVMLQSRAGHTFLMDDSVEQPKPDQPRWELGQGMVPFDYDGCTGKYKGRMAFLESSGHYLEFNASEDFPQRRGENNGIKLHTASGNEIFLCDQDDQEECKGGEGRGIHMLTTSRHTFDMVDHGCKNCSPARQCGGTPTNDADKAYVQLRTGYGLRFRMDDATDQQQTTEQFIELYCPQYDNEECGPHIFRMQERPGHAGPKPMIYLRAGGEYFIQTHDDMFELVGEPPSDEGPGNPANKVEIITRDKVVYCFGDYVNKAERHVFLADDQIFLLAGKDCPPPPGETGCGPCAAPVVVYMGGCLRISDRVFASCSTEASPASIMMLTPLSPCPPPPGCGGGDDDGGGGGSGE